MTTTVASLNDWKKLQERATILEAEGVDLRDRITALEEKITLLEGGTATEEV